MRFSNIETQCKTQELVKMKNKFINHTGIQVWVQICGVLLLAQLLGIATWCDHTKAWKGSGCVLHKFGNQLAASSALLCCTILSSMCTRQICCDVCLVCRGDVPSLVVEALLLVWSALIRDSKSQGLGCMLRQPMWKTVIVEIPCPYLYIVIVCFCLGLYRCLTGWFLGAISYPCGLCREFYFFYLGLLFGLASAVTNSRLTIWVGATVAGALLLSRA